MVNVFGFAVVSVDSLCGETGPAKVVVVLDALDPSLFLGEARSGMKIADHCGYGSDVESRPCFAFIGGIVVLPGMGIEEIPAFGGAVEWYHI